jgi:hypothetical protein
VSSNEGFPCGCYRRHRQASRATAYRGGPPCNRDNAAEKKRAELYELGAEPLLCDVFDARKLRSIMARAEPDAVINELTDLPQSLNPRKLAEYYAANNRVRREGTRNLLSAPSVPGFGASSYRVRLTGTRRWADR